jgi:serine/threonine-protein kinase
VELPDETDTLFATAGASRGPLGDAVARRLDPVATIAAGTEIGPFRVLSELGRGGMGLVLLAERADGAFEQRVALKLIKHGVDTDEVLARFRQERQILASLNHANIARLLDGGITPDGRPFFAMEPVDGEPIDRFCARRKLDVDERLDLFVTVARAVAYAHRSLVVHRDLKPSNVLVTEAGEVKLLDFGIARLLSPGGGPPDAGYTMPGTRVMSPPYASPEQIRGGPATTASDVYQLGLLLFELLTGRPAFQLGDGGQRELERAICEDAPPLPGQAAGRRYGDLDNIVAMALRKEAARRYPSVEHLIEDVTRYRRRRPVRARRDSVIYRTSRFLRRHPVASASTIGAALVLGATVVYYTSRLAAERDRAQLAAAKAAQVSSFLKGLFEVSDPARAKGGEITARELLEQGARRIETDLATQPLIQAEMLATTGDIFTKLGSFDRAGQLLRRALELRVGQEGDGTLAVAETQALLGVLHRARNAEPEAEPLFRQSLAIRERLLGPDHPDVANALLQLASLTMSVGKEEREALLRRARAIQERALGPDHPDLATTDEQLATLYWMLGRYREMQPLYERARAIRERAQGADHPDVAANLRGIGASHMILGEFQQAEVALTRALAIEERVLGRDHPTTAWTVNNLASLYGQWGRDELAEPMYRRYLSIAEKAFGAAHNQTAIALGNLGGFFVDRGRLAEAEPLIERALQIQERVHGPEHPNVAWALGNVAGLRQAQRRYDEAEQLYRRALAIREATSGPASPAVAVCLMGIASVQAATGRHREAVPFFERALAIREQSLGPSHADVAATLRAFAGSLRAVGRNEEAAALERRTAGTR